MYTIKVTLEHLEKLRMLADWQLRELGYDPASVTAACATAERYIENSMKSAIENGRPGVW